MADDDKDEKKGKKGKGKDGEEGGKKGKSNMVPAVIIAVGLILGGKMMGGGGAAAAPEAAATVEAAHEELDCEAEDAKKAPVEGAVVKLESVSINLANSHYLKVGVALQLSSAENAEEFEKEGLAAKAANEVLGVLSGRTIEELSTQEAVDHVREELTHRVRPLYECQVLEVLFTEFVMQ